MKRTICLLLALLLALGLTAAVAEGYTPGTYEVTAAGFGGEMKVAVTFSEDAITEVTVLENSETVGVGSVAVEQLPAKFVEANSADIDGLTGCTFSSNALKQAVADAIALASGEAPAAAPAAVNGYTPGTYEVTAAGFGGEMKVAVTFSEDAITEVTVLENSETVGVGSVAVEQLPAKFVEANSADIDGLTGCTFSSNALKQAVADAIALAAK